MEDRLRKFARVVETNSFTKASKELHISQPALSTAIRKLEHELKAEFFARRIPPFKLTHAGKLAYRYAKSLDARSRNFKLELLELSHQKPTLSIGMIDSVAHMLFAEGDYLSHLKAQAQISLTINNSRQLTQTIEQGDLDMTFVTSSSNFSPQLRSRLLGYEPLIGVTTPGLLGSVTRAMEQGSLSNLLSYDRTSNTDRLIREHFEATGIELQTIFRSTSPEILRHLVLQGEGVAILPYFLVRNALDQHKLVKAVGPIARPIIALENRDRTTVLPLLALCQNLQLLLSHLETEVQKLK